MRTNLSPLGAFTHSEPASGGATPSLPAASCWWQAAQILWKISDRVVLSYVNAKRLALSLGQLVKRYEQQFGELNVQRQQNPPAR